MKKRLLLADDSVTIQKVVQITFSHEDYELTVVDNGDIAYEKARSQRPDLILADVFMPGKNGYELCAAVKNDPLLAAVPVLLLTGTFEPFDEAKAKSVGADRWIAKPFESQALIACVEELLKLAAQAAPVIASQPLAPASPLAPVSFSDAVDDFASPDLSADLSDDLWGSDFTDESTVVSSDRISGDSFSAPNQDDLWDVNGFETDIAVPSTADSDDLWGSFDPTPTPAESITLTTAVVETDSWGDDGFATSFADDADATVVSAPFVSESAEIPFVDDIEVLEEIDLVEQEDSPLEIISEEHLALDDFAFADEEVLVEELEPLDEFVEPVPAASVVTPVPLPIQEIAPCEEKNILPINTLTSEILLSNEQLELIVERVAGVVISRLAGTLLEKIAWEVVPDLAEVMIKEELRKIRESVAAA